MDVAFAGGTIIPVNDKREVLEDAGLLIEGSRITLLGSAQEIREAAQLRQIEIIDFHGKVLFPGLINTHTHLFQNILKGLGSGYVLEEWWSKTVGHYGVSLDGEAFGIAARAGMLEAAKTGTTTILDYSYANPVPQVGDRIIQAAEEIGLRLIYGRGFNVSNSFVPEALREPLEQVFEDAKRLREQYPKTDIWLAPAVNWTMTREELIRMSDFARHEGFPVTMHLAETATDARIWQENYQKELIEDLEDMGLLDQSFLAVHFVDVSDQDMKILGEHSAGISHNPLSNMYLASGVCPVPGLLKQGISVSLGTDGAASNNTLDMLETMKMTALLQKVHHRNPQAITAMDVLEMATIQGARVLNREHEIGSLAVGKQADLFMLDPDASLKSSPMHDPLATLLYSSGENSVSDVMVAGEFVIRNHVSVRTNEKEAIQALNRSAGQMIERSGGYHD
jgi:5-methylthioadenosine/S-adenosylhomocysteine deaminase